MLDKLEDYHFGLSKYHHLIIIVVTNFGLIYVPFIMCLYVQSLVWEKLFEKALFGFDSWK